MENSSSTGEVFVPVTNTNQFEVIHSEASTDLDDKGDVSTIPLPEIISIDVKKNSTDMPDLTAEIQCNNVTEQTVDLENQVPSEISEPEVHKSQEVVEEFVEPQQANQEHIIATESTDGQTLVEDHEEQQTILESQEVKATTEIQELKVTEEIHAEPTVVDVVAEPYDESVEENQINIREEASTIEEPAILEEQHATATEEVGESVEVIEEATEGHEIMQVQDGIEEVEEHVVTETSIEEKMETSTENEEELEIQGQAVIEEQVVFNNDMQIDPENHNGNQEVITAEEHSTVVIVSSENNVYPEGSKSIVVTSEDGEESTVTVQEVRDEVTGEVYYVEAVDLNEGEDYLQETVEIVEERTKSVSIPSHVLGRNINNPSIDPFRNGKAPPKPRLGVKIPYRNLTSQIVSKQEITDEILERSRRNRDSPTGQNLFAKKLTQALAKKIAPSRKPNRTSASSSTKSSENVSGQKEKKINNTDLLAILEGDDDDYKKETEEVTPIVAAEPEEVKEMTKELERELALKQLSELPDDVPLQVNRGKSMKRSAKIVPKIKEIQGDDSSKQKSLAVQESEKSVALKQLEGIIPSVAINRKSKKSKLENVTAVEEKKISTDNIAETLEDDLPDLPNNFSTSLPLKTYTRKRKPSDEGIAEKSVSVAQVVITESTKKIDLPQGNSHTAKRIIKKKVIWDPDEATPRKVVKTDDKPSDKKETLKVKESFKDKKTDKVEHKNDAKKTDTTSKSEKSQEINIRENEQLDKSEKTAKMEKKHISDTHRVDKKLKTEHKIQSDNPKNIKSSPKIDKKVPDIPKTIKNQELVKGDKKKEVAKIDKKTDSPKMKIPDTSNKIKVQDTPKTDKKSTDSLKSDKKLIESPQSDDEAETPKRGRGRPRKFEDEGTPLVTTKKRLTEIDKLLMDEGAANMLYSLKNIEEDTSKKSKPNKSLVSKTNELLNDLQQTTDTVSPKALRKKESGPPTPDKSIKSPKKIIVVSTPSAISRQKSRDSNRSSLQSPPPSPSPMFTAEASRIIRRHSSSSYSSMDEEDEATANEEKTKMKKPAEVKVGRRKADSSSESPKKKAKKDVTDAAKKELNEEMSKNFNKLVKTEIVMYDEYESFEVKTMDQLLQIVLTPNNNNNIFVNVVMLQELCSILHEIENDDDITVVLISSSGSAFCNGINYKTLLTQNKKGTARKLATSIREFLLCLAKFPKVLVAGIHGDVVGLGVTMLPLFDVVLASDSATFSTPHARLGCIAEGGSMLSLPHLSQHVLASELLFSSRKLISSEAHKLGLVTRILWPDKFQEELISITKIMSKQSVQFMVATKKQIRVRRLPTVTAALNSETETLVQHWTSPECQKNFSQV